MSNDDVIKHVTCTVKPPVYLHFGDSKEDPSHSGVCVLDVNLPFGKSVNVEAISFKNSYTAFVSVRLQRRTPGQEAAAAKWVTAVRDFPLMKNPHTEAGSQDFYAIRRTQMQIEADHVTALRLILRQPSCAWLTFSLEDIRIFPRTQTETDKELSDWLSALTLVDRHSDVEEGLPDPQTVSCSLQQMWALTEVMQSSQSSASIGRFDVDGCYDVNFLSVT
ncbi:nicolin-1 [Nerophis ophidion]|uniref:nicolin-1 n=1 Tax=Nerophis ophidion TaxID=159077 RepID=UPI002AE06E8A|nr:nicolin-1 [Nerophis ophidion]XP_061730991.1 nicolin-1 [Nerophis ophidion]XP_061730993.1 nicolin-1 [Nerophis ophidion]XP_061730994.1 nicolin-1 [Nerophis ophidion]